MMRKPNKQSPGRNAEQKRLMDWIHEQPCAACREDSPVEAHHILGETWSVKINLIKENLGHWAILALCNPCHLMLDRDKALFHERYGMQMLLWNTHTYDAYFEQKGVLIGVEIYCEIMKVNK